jgi:hypothetical protein
VFRQCRSEIAFHKPFPGLKKVWLGRIKLLSFAKTLLGFEIKSLRRVAAPWPQGPLAWNSVQWSTARMAILAIKTLQSLVRIAQIADLLCRVQKKRILCQLQIPIENSS